MRIDRAIVPVKLASGGIDGELPVNLDAFFMALVDDSHDFVLKLLKGWNAPLEAQAGQGREFDLNHIEPTGGLGRVMEREPLGESQRFVRR